MNHLPKFTSPWNTSRKGVTLIELLVVVAVLAVLFGLGVTGLKQMFGKGALTREIAAGKTLITASTAYAADHGGRYMMALDTEANDVVDENGRQIGIPIARARYPYRLAPYFDYQLEGTILLNKNKKQIEETMPPGWDQYGYSNHPAMGINRYLFGGQRNNDSVDFEADCLTRQGQASKAVLAFASAGTDELNGFEYLIPPQLNGFSRWPSEEWTPDSNASFGNLHPRYNGKTVCAFTDGSVRVLSVEELRDMRLWCRTAADQDDPNYSPRLSL